MKHSLIFAALVAATSLSFAAEKKAEPVKPVTVAASAPAKAAPAAAPASAPAAKVEKKAGAK